MESENQIQEHMHPYLSIKETEYQGNEYTLEKTRRKS